MTRVEWPEREIVFSGRMGERVGSQRMKERCIHAEDNGPDVWDGGEKLKN